MLFKEAPAEQNLVDEISQKANVKQKRTKMHSINTVHWLRKRFHQTANVNYLHFPEELQKELEVRNIFRNFDEDKSGKLGLLEFHKMLNEAHIDIDLEDLKRFYERVDKNNDVALDYQEFKNCTLSDEANRYFSEMVNKSIGKAKQLERENKSPTELMWKDAFHEDVTEKEKQNHFIPRSFGNLMNYISYRTKKDELVKAVHDESTPTQKKFEGFRKLFDLKMDKDVYMEHVSAKFDFSLSPKLRRNLSLASPKGFENIENKSGKIKSLGLHKHSVSNLPMIHQTDFMSKKIKDEINELVMKAQHEAYREFFERELKRTHPSRFVDILTAERSFSVESVDEQPSVSLLSPKAFKRPTKPLIKNKDLNSPSDRVPNSEMFWSSGRDSPSVNNINQASTGFIPENKEKRILEENNEEQPILLETKGLGSTKHAGLHKHLTKKAIPQRRLRESSNAFKLNLHSEPSVEICETQETGPSECVITLNGATSKTLGQTLVGYNLDFSPTSSTKVTWTDGIEEPKLNNNSILCGRKPAIRSHMNSNSISYSKLPRGYINVAPVYDSQTNRRKDHTRLKTILQNGPLSPKDSSGRSRPVPPSFSKPINHVGPKRSGFKLNDKFGKK